MGLRQSIILSVLQRYGTQIITFATGVAIARLLTPGQVGVFAIALSVVAFLDVLRTMGVGSYFITERALTTEQLRTAAGINWLFGVLISAVVLALSEPAARFYEDQQVGTVLRILALSNLVAPFGGVAQILLVREMRFRALLQVGLAASSIQGALAVALAVLDYGPVSLAWGVVASNAVSAVGFNFSVREARWLRPSLRGWLEPFRMGSWLTATGLASTAGMQAAQLLIGKTLSLGDLALYSRALNLCNNVSALFYAAAIQPALPAFARAEREQPGGLVRIYLRLVAVITGLGWPAYAVLAIWAEPLVVFLYGEQWRPAAAILPALCLGSALPLALTPNGQPLIAHRRVRLLFVCEAGLLINWLVLLLAFSRHGLQAIAIAFIVSHVVWLCAYLIALKAVLRFPMRGILQVWYKSAVVTISVATAVAIIRFSPIGDALPVPAALALSGFLGGLAWLSTVWLIRHEYRRHVVDLVHWTLKKPRGITPRLFHGEASTSNRSLSSKEK